MATLIFTKNVNKQAISEHITFLNKLKMFKDNNLLACKPVYMHTKNPSEIGNTFCDIYSRKTKKRIQLNTRILFSNSEFIKNSEGYLLKYIDKLK